MSSKVTNRVASDVKPRDAQRALAPLLGRKAEDVTPGDQVEYSRTQLAKLGPKDRQRALRVLQRQ